MGMDDAWTKQQWATEEQKAGSTTVETKLMTYPTLKTDVDIRRKLEQQREAREADDGAVGGRTNELRIETGRPNAGSRREMSDLCVGRDRRRVILLSI